MTYDYMQLRNPIMWRFWEAVKERLSTPRMAYLNRGDDRVFLGYEDYRGSLGDATEQWGRVVVQPVSDLIDGQMPPHGKLIVKFLVRPEGYVPSGYDVSRTLEQKHREAQDRLIGWNPGDLDGVRIVHPVWMYSPPHPMPLFDTDRKIHYTSSEYRTVVVAN